MKKHILFQFAAASAIALSTSMVSCGNDQHDGQNHDSNTADTGAVVQEEVRDIITVPSPSDMFQFMKTLGPKTGNGNLLNPIDNEKKYESKKAQALNLGVYSADLLYCSTFGVSDKVVGYFGTSMRMGDKLQVATGLTDKDKERIAKNTGNADSLVSVGNDLYLATFYNLEDNQRGADVSLMLAGGWVESLYLMTNMVGDFDKNQEAAGKIALQKHSLGNLVEYMTKYESNADVASVLQQMKELQVLFDAIQSTTTEGGMTAQEGKRKKLGGGSKLSITKEQFEAIKKKTEDIRKSFIEAQ